MRIQLGLFEIIGGGVRSGQDRIRYLFPDRIMYCRNRAHYCENVHIRVHWGRYSLNVSILERGRSHFKIVMLEKARCEFEMSWKCVSSSKKHTINIIWARSKTGCAFIMKSEAFDIREHGRSYFKLGMLEKGRRALGTKWESASVFLKNTQQT